MDYPHQQELTDVQLNIIRQIEANKGAIQAFEEIVRVLNNNLAILEQTDPNNKSIVKLRQAIIDFKRDIQIIENTNLVLEKQQYFSPGA